METINRTIQKVITFRSYDGFLEYSTELYNNPDFTCLGWFDSLNELQDELRYQGLSLELIKELNLNRYGNVLEVLKYNGQYLAFIGAY